MTSEEALDDLILGKPPTATIKRINHCIFGKPSNHTWEEGIEEQDADEVGIIEGTDYYVERYYTSNNFYLDFAYSETDLEFCINFGMYRRGYLKSKCPSAKEFWLYAIVLPKKVYEKNWGSQRIQGGR